MAALVIAAGVVIGGGILLLATGVPRGGTHTLTGTLGAPECAGGYQIENASVEIRDQSNDLIGSGSTGSDSVGDQCRVAFTIEDLPKADFYQVRIGTHGGPSYTYDELQSHDWELNLSLD